MAGELFKSMAKVSITHVPYKGSAGARTDVLGGQVEMMFDALTTMTEQAKAGKVKALATTGKQRSEVMPDVPTVSEAGVTGYEATIWLGVMAPKNTPKAIVESYHDALVKIMANADLKERFAGLGVEAQASTQDEFKAFLAAEHSKYSKLIADNNIKAD
jgi:tripartite-type tricarboxylate transporter receptor subunit TctC